MTSADYLVPSWSAVLSSGLVRVSPGGGAAAVRSRGRNVRVCRLWPAAGSGGAICPGGGRDRCQPRLPTADRGGGGPGADRHW